ncbi:MAG: hypothetical protein RIB98_04490 [Acidimicrobiales bacterium]
MTESRSPDARSSSTDTSATANGRRVLVLPPENDDARIAFDHALEMAGSDGAIVLFDRSLESWRPDEEGGLHEANDSAFDDMPGMEAARAGASSGGRGLQVWQSTSPAIGTAILDVLQHANITDIVLPSDGQSSASSDVVLGDDSSLASAVRSVLDKPLSQDAFAQGAGVAPTLHLTEPAETD